MTAAEEYTRAAEEAYEAELDAVEGSPHEGTEAYADGYNAAIARARKTFLDEALAAIRKAAPPTNAELSMQGGAGPFVDRGMEAYIEGFHEAHDVVAALREAAGGTEPKGCTCPSGDGSLRWPCPQHPPVPEHFGESFVITPWPEAPTAKKED